MEQREGENDVFLGSVKTEKKVVATMDSGDSTLRSGQKMSKSIKSRLHVS